MNFFSKLSQSGITDVIIQFEQNEQGEITLFVAPKTISRKNLLKTINPIRFVGKPEEVDLDFFTKLDEHLVDVPKFEKTEPTKEKVEKVKEEVEIVEEQKEEVIEKQDPKHPIDPIAEQYKDVPVGKTPIGELPKTKAKAEPEPKVDNIKPLKEFYEIIKKDDILPFREAIELALSKLTEKEMEKPYPKKVKNDLEIRIRKEENKIAALKKHGFITDDKPAEAVEAVTDDNFGTEVITTRFTPEEADQQIKEANGGVEFDGITAEEIEVVEEILEKVETPVIPIAQPIPSSPVPVAPIPLPVPEAPQPIQVKRFRQETKEILKMIVEDFTYEQYRGVGWSDQQLIDNGRAIIEEVIVDIEISEEEYQDLISKNNVEKIPVPEPMAPPAPKLSYTFPKPFDAVEETEK